MTTRTTLFLALCLVLEAMVFMEFLPWHIYWQNFLSYLSHKEESKSNPLLGNVGRTGCPLWDSLLIYNK